MKIVELQTTVTSYQPVKWCCPLAEAAWGSLVTLNGEGQVVLIVGGEPLQYCPYCGQAIEVSKGVE